MLSAGRLGSSRARYAVKPTRDRHGQGWQWSGRVADSGAGSSPHGGPGDKLALSARQVFLLLGVVLVGITLAIWSVQLAVLPEASILEPIRLAGTSPADDEDFAAPADDEFEFPVQLPVEPVGEPSPDIAPAPMPQPVAPAQDQPRVRRVRMVVTAYCPCRTCCGKWSAYRKTASGHPVTANGGQFVAADTGALPFGTMVRIPGYAGFDAVPVLDRGRLIRGYRLDVYFTSHAQAKAWGRQVLWVDVIEKQ